MLSPEHNNTVRMTEQETRTRLFEEAMRLGLGDLANRARLVLEGVGIAPNPRQTVVGWIRTLRDIANVDEETFTPEL